MFKSPQTLEPIALALALFLLVCQVPGWFIAQRPAQTRTGRLTARCHPLITRRVVTCSLYLVFKEPTPARPGNPLPAAPPNSLWDRFWGNLLRLLKTSWRVNSGLVWDLSAREGKKNAPIGFRSSCPAVSIHALGVGSNPLQLPDVSGYWLSRLCRVSNPGALSNVLHCCVSCLCGRNQHCTLLT
jgi:hypothetical protein